MHDGRINNDEIPNGNVDTQNSSYSGGEGMKGWSEQGKGGLFGTDANAFIALKTGGILITIDLEGFNFVRDWTLLQISHREPFLF